MDIYFETAIKILKTISGSNAGMSIRSLIKETGLHRSKVARYLTKLEELGYVYRVRQRSTKRGLPPDLWFLKGRK